MSNLKIAFLLVLFVILLSCAPATRKAPPSAPEKPEALAAAIAKLDWETEWEKNLAKAQREGKVSVYSTLKPEVRSALLKAFKEKFNLSVEFTVGKSRELMAKIITEHRAELYLADVYLGGVNTPERVLKPEGLLDDLKAHLFLPEVADPNVWFEKKLPFTDDEGKYILGFRASVSEPDLLYNNKQVKEGEILSYYDLLQPKWKGKMSLLDPLSRSKAFRFVVTPLYKKALDMDYFKALARQEPVIIGDERLQVEWTARGKYPLALSPDSEFVREFLLIGAPLSQTFLKEEVRYVSSGTGGMALIKNPPHPNARKIFINWLLGREGQTVHSIGDSSQSARVDVPVGHLHPHQIRDPKISYFRHDDPAFNRAEPDYIPIVREIFGPLLIR